VSNLKFVSQVPSLACWQLLARHDAAGSMTVCSCSPERTAQRP
jgi:hypothetical protein